MSVVPFLYLIFAVVLGIGWKFARRKLTEKELKAWEWREQHPYAMWVRVCLGAFLFFDAMVLAFLYIGSLIFHQPLSGSGSELAPFFKLESQFVSFLMAAMIGTLAFSFWYWNGVALYRSKLLDDRSAMTPASRSSMN